MLCTPAANVLGGIPHPSGKHPSGFPPAETSWGIPGYAYMRTMHDQSIHDGLYNVVRTWCRPNCVVLAFFGLSPRIFAALLHRWLYWHSCIVIGDIEAMACNWARGWPWRARAATARCSDCNDHICSAIKSQQQAAADGADIADAVLLVDHDLTEHSAEQSTTPVGDAPCLDVHVSGHQRLSALNVQSRFEQRVVETTDEATHRRLVERFFSARVVSVDDQLVKVVHVVTVVDALVCNHNNTDTLSLLLSFSFYNLTLTFDPVTFPMPSLIRLVWTW